eukprot:6200358-Pleurochrysis_carterae.AAC.1
MHPALAKLESVGARRSDEAPPVQLPVRPAALLLNVPEGLKHLLLLRPEPGDSRLGATASDAAVRARGASAAAHAHREHLRRRLVGLVAIAACGKERSAKALTHKSKPAVWFPAQLFLASRSNSERGVVANNGKLASRHLNKESS